MLDNHINAFHVKENSLDTIEISISRITELLEKIQIVKLYMLVQVHLLE